MSASAYYPVPFRGNPPRKARAPSHIVSNHFRSLRIPKNVLINFVGGAWAGLLIVLTTPFFVARLGLEGFGLIGFWQLLIYLSMVLDFGFGTACARELARLHDSGNGQAARRGLLAVFERPVLGIACAMAVTLFAVATPVAGQWLHVTDYPAGDVVRALQWMSLSVAGQFLAGFYANGLAGLQRMATMNVLQALNNGLRFLGGALIAWLVRDIVAFFAFQAFVGVLNALLTRVWLVRTIGPAQRLGPTAFRLREFTRFSGGMFVTAVFGALLSNADRLAVSFLLPAEALGKYSVSLTAIGLLQMFVFAFHRAYFPRFSQLSAAGDLEVLKRTYYDACALVGMVLVPVGLVFLLFTPELFVVWLGWSDASTVSVSRYLVLGFVLSGVMWLPAAYQQALGRTRLHAMLMAATLALGIPLMVWAILRWGMTGAATLMFVHGVIQVTIALWLMNRALFPGENLLWYRRVLVAPLLTCVLPVAISAYLIPTGLSRLALATWILATFLSACLALVAQRTWEARASKAKHRA